MIVTVRLPVPEPVKAKVRHVGRKLAIESLASERIIPLRSQRL